MISVAKIQQNLFKIKKLIILTIYEFFDVIYATFIINNNNYKGVINMNIKKIGLTALAGSLITTSAFAGSMMLLVLQVYL